MTLKQSRKPNWEVIHGDCLEQFSQVADGAAKLVFADPPFNIGRNYDEYDDLRPADDYIIWCHRWLSEIHRVTHRHGSFWLAIGDKYVSELDVLTKSFGFHKRSHVVWAYTFGVNCANNFTRAHTHLLYYTKTKTRYTFNAQDPQVRVPSARQLVYNDKRANPKGRLPDDVWVLRPRELETAFNGDADVWLVSRVCGTFNERVKGSDNQMPRAILDRIVLTCSNPGDLVLDPMVGTGTTGESAILAGRDFWGCEISKTYCDGARKRLTRAAASRK